MGTFDYVMIVGYLLFIPYIGVTFRKVSKDASDFYRGGGTILWWLSGASITVAGFSAWTFTGGAAKAYDTGFILPIAYVTMIFSLAPLYWIFAARFRQMRAVTMPQAVKRRYGSFTEQFWVWLQLPINIFYAGLGLQTVSLFVGSALGIEIPVVIVILGIVVWVLTVGGGEWATNASDFLQLVIIVTITSIVAYKAVTLPEIELMGGYVKNLPEQYFDWESFQRSEIVYAWLATFALVNLINSSNLAQNGAKYLSVKDGPNARKSVLFQMVMLPITTAIFFVPVYACAMVFKDLPSMYPHLKIASEASYLAIAAHVLPEGMFGLMVCCIFAAAISTLDTGLNRSSGFFVVNVYQRFINPEVAPEKQVLVGRITTSCLALLMIGIAQLIYAKRDLNLFDFVILIGGLVGTPMVVPMVLGLLIRNTPKWSGWVTVAFGLLVSFSVKYGLDVQKASNWLGIEGPLNRAETADMTFIFITVITLVATTVFFLGTIPFYSKEKPEFQKEVDAFFLDMRTPVEYPAGSTDAVEIMQFRLISYLLFVFGGFVLCGVLIPNSWGDRFLFVIAGGVIMFLGAVFRWFYSRKIKN